MSFAQCNGSRIAYQQMGQGPDLVMIHGLATNRAFWYVDLAQRLKAWFRVTLFDLRGHGYSERTQAGYAAQDMAELMDHLGIGRAHLLGHSYGGGVALEFAVMHPHRVRSLTMLDAKINRLQPTQYLADRPLSDFEQAVVEADGRDWSAEPHVGLRYLRVMAELRIKGIDTRTRDQYTPFGQGRGDLRSARQYLALLDETLAEREFSMTGASREELASLLMPMLLMYGADSRCLPSGREMHRLHPEAQLVVVPGAGHFFPASHPDLVFDQLADFLDCASPLAAGHALERIRQAL